MAVAALDLGRRRIGVAVAEARHSAAYPVGTLERRSVAKDLQALGAMLASRGVERVIVGLPLNMDGSEGPPARAARSFARKLAEALNITVELYDERLTSFEAEDRLRRAGGQSRIKKHAVDALAAVIILEGWLQAAASGGR